MRGLLSSERADGASAQTPNRLARSGRAARLMSAGAVVLALAVPFGRSATAAELSEPIADGLAGPLQLAVAPDGSILVSQAFAGLLTKFSADGTSSEVIASEEGEIAGVVAPPRARVTYTATLGDENGTTGAYLRRIEADGSITTVADLLAYETNRNPDAGLSYGFQGLDAECADSVPEEVGGGYPVGGGIDSHPYAIAAVGSSRVVADAGGNTLLMVGPRGRVKTLAVLPPQPHIITASNASEFGLPECTVGETYNFEAVPTDVELGPDGNLYATTLPGGPEDPRFGARGSVYRVNVLTGSARRIATGFAGATNLAVTPNGRIFVAELFGGQISRAFRGSPRPVVALDTPAGLEWSSRGLVVSYQVFDNGSVAYIEV